ncbi:MAG: hypothetical protein IJS46_04680 [Kiritimatiellae bacterium]|nr:hypothetical protein [Kiritimatiellia bacterium]
MRRILICFIAAAAAKWFLWHPAETGTLLAALPPRSVAAAFVRDIASQEKALLQTRAFEEAMLAIGEDPEKLREENAGTYATLFWLTGRRSAVAAVPKAGECGGLGFYLAGASAVGCKTRVLEFLRFVKYVPFLGPLKTTAAGTRYMEFSGHGFLPKNKIVLGLEVVDGVLCAALAQDPDLVLEVASRVREAKRGGGSAAFFGADDGNEWLNAPLKHRAWIRPAALGGGGQGVAEPWLAVLDIGSFKDHALHVRASFPAPESFAPPQPPGGERFAETADWLAIPRTGALFCAAGDVSPLIPAVEPALPVAPGCGALAIAASPYAGRISIVEAPSARAVLPVGAGAQSGENPPLDRLRACIDRAAKHLKPRWRMHGDGTALLHFKNLRTNLFGETPDSDCAWMRLSPDGGVMSLGTHFGSAAAQDRDGKSLARSDTVGGALCDIAAASPGCFAVSWADFAALSAAARQFRALMALGERMGALPQEDSAARSIDAAFQALSCAGGLGRTGASATFEKGGDGGGRIVVDAVSETGGRP